MKSIMISIKPEWVERILSGEKTIEIRKTMPKCELPCRVFIYCTKSIWHLLDLRDKDLPIKYGINRGRELEFDPDSLNGKVVAEFTLKKVTTHPQYGVHSGFGNKYWYENLYELGGSCLLQEEIEKYGNGRTIYGWHIDDLKVYDKPKQLSEFLSMKECSDKDWGDPDTIGCWECCDAYDCGYCYGGKEPMFRAPQSWCYCEEVK